MDTNYEDKRTGDIAEKNILKMDGSVLVADAARSMRKEGVSSVIVTNAAVEPVGIVTERDILYRLVAEHRSPFKVNLKDIMSSPLIVIDESASVNDAIVLMRKNVIRRMPVTKMGKIIGMLTLKSVIGDSRERAIDLVDVEGAHLGPVACPYCGSKFEDKEILSKHIDRLHLGSGLLEGDLRQW